MTIQLLSQLTPPPPEPRPPAVYRYLICRTSDGLILDELPLSTNALPRQIGTDTTTTFQLPLNDPRTGPQWAGLTDPRRVPMVVVLRDEKPAWAGLIATQRGINTLDLGAVSLEGWFARRVYPAILALGSPGSPIATTQFFGVDQLKIARSIVHIAAEGKEGDEFFGLGMGIDTHSTSTDSGVFRDRRYEGEEAADALTRLTELAGVINGFEWTIELDYSPGDTNVTPRLAFGYPTLGIRTAEPEWRFELGVGGVGGNVVDYDLNVDASVGKFADRLISFGAGEGEARLTSEPAEDREWIDEIGLILDMQTAHSTVKLQPMLDAHAAADLEAVRRGESILTVRARSDLDPRFGQYGLGDDVRVVVEDTPRHPRHAAGSPGLDVVTRILGWTLDPSTDQVDLDLEGVDV